MTFRPHQYAADAPNYHWLEENATYSMNFDTTGSGRSDLSFDFIINTRLHDILLDVGGQRVSIPTMAIGPMNSRSEAIQFGNLQEDIQVFARRGKKKRGLPLLNFTNGERVFVRAPDYVGQKTYPNYEGMINEYIYPVTIPNCNEVGRLFIGQRLQPTEFNRGKFYDLFSLNLLGNPNLAANPDGRFNITALALEIHRDCFQASSNVLGAWGSVQIRQTRKFSKKASFRKIFRQVGRPIQVARIGNPLVDDLIIGLGDHNRFHNTEPSKDRPFEVYYTNPALPELIRLVQGIAPPGVPRSDLQEVYLTGIPDLNQTNGRGEMLRLNMDSPIVRRGAQNRLGVLGGDNSGFPNGRRPGDDVVDITLQLLMGARSPGSPSGNLNFNDGNRVRDIDFRGEFPYLNTPLAGNAQ